MELAHRFERLRFLSGLTDRIQELQKNPLPLPAPSPALRRRVRGALLVILSIVLASFAHEVARTEALESWIHENAPSSRIWRHALGAQSFQAVKSPNLMHRVLRSLPTTLDAVGSVWISQDSSWVVVFGGSEDKGSDIPLIYTRAELTPRGELRDRTNPVKHWSPAGRGWEAFDQVLERVEKMRAPPVFRPKKARVRTYIDPRAIIY